MKVFSYHNLEVFDVEEIPTHGGSLRLYVKHTTNNHLSVTSNVKMILDKEYRYGLDDIITYKNFSDRVMEVREKLYEFLLASKKSGKKVVGYGAPAKGNTLLNFCKIDKSMLP